jgi:hypothetical protein
VVAGAPGPGSKASVAPAGTWLAIWNAVEWRVMAVSFN